MDISRGYFESINKITKNEFKSTDIKTFIDSAHYILQKASKINRIKDDFSFYFYDPTKIFVCGIKSEKTQTSYNLLYDQYENEIVFYSDLRNWWNIRNIKDSFWVELLRVVKDYNVRFIADSGPYYDKKKTPEFNAKYKSLVFSIMSVYITLMLKSEEEREEMSMGQLELAWTVEKSIEDIIHELNIVFKVFYRFNYLLWKSNDIRKQNKSNREKRK